MTTKLLSLALAFSTAFASAQTLIQEGFDNISTLAGAGWTMSNKSNPVGTSAWFQGNINAMSSQAGAPTSYIAANFNNTAGAGTISNWLVVPNKNLKNGDVIKFWTATPGNEFPDNLEVRLSTGTTPTMPTDDSSTGSFSTLLLEIDPELAGTYPTTWTEYTLTLSGLPAEGTDANIAFRYYVPDGGPSGTYSNYIGIDTFSITRPTAGTSDVDKNAISIYPNPATDYIKINTDKKISSVEIYDTTGRRGNVGITNNEIDVRNLKAGVYVLKVKVDETVINKKFIKK